MDHGSITLLLMARGHTASWEQTPLHYGEACPPATCLPASQLRTLLQNTRHTKHHTPNIGIQPTLEHSSPISTSNTPPSRRSHHSSIVNQSIDQWSMYGSMGAMVRDLEWRGRHFLLFLWAIVMDKASALRMPSPVWINIAPEKSFQSIRSLSIQSSSQSHTRSIHSLTIFVTKYDYLYKYLYLLAVIYTNYKSLIYFLSLNLYKEIYDY